MDNSKIIKVGDYVLATRWSDGDSQDPWCVGFYAGVSETGSHVVSYGDGLSRTFRKVKKISKARGDFIIKNKPAIERMNKSLLWWSSVSMKSVEGA